jgi:GAF domain-containing protein
LLDRPADAILDRLTRLAGELLEAPMALLTLIDVDRQFFASAYGLREPLRSARQTPLDYSICQYAVASGRPLIVNDAQRDARLAGHPAVQEFGIAAYAGIPLVTEEGYTVGAFCVLDVVPRGWTADGLAILAHLAAVANEVLDARSQAGPAVSGTQPG